MRGHYFPETQDKLVMSSTFIPSPTMQNINSPSKTSVRFELVGDTLRFMLVSRWLDCNVKLQPKVTVTFIALLSVLLLGGGFHHPERLVNVLRAFSAVASLSQSE